MIIDQSNEMKNGIKVEKKANNVLKIFTKKKKLPKHLLKT